MAGILLNPILPLSNRGVFTSQNVGSRFNTTDGDACSTLKQTFCGGASPPQDICNAISDCCADSDDQLISTKCVNGLVGVNKGDIESAGDALQKVAPAGLDLFCSAAKANIDLVNKSTDLESNIARLSAWYANDVSPAVLETCAKSKVPINANDMAASARKLHSALCGPTDILSLPKDKLFVLKYWKPIIGSLAATAIAFLLITIGLSIALGRARRSTTALLVARASKS